MEGAVHDPTAGRLLGYCPTCEVPIGTDGVLVEYETGNGWPQVFAECPSCRDVVHPR